MKKHRILALAVIIIQIFCIYTMPVFAKDNEDTQKVLNSVEVKQMIEDARDAELAPGVSIVVADGSDAIYYNSGYADVDDGKKATENTLYELGSTTKAFTALAALILDDEGALSLDENVSTYVPWFNVKYEGKTVNVTIKQLLLHTSGLPDRTLNNFPEGTSDELLEKTARLTEGIELDFMPGTEYEYANIGYDLMAYILETVTGEKYEDFVTKRILSPLGMKNSSFDYKYAESTGNMAQGYLQFFKRAIEYDAPRYQGCLADGYLITSASDMGLWLNAQMGGSNVPEQLSRLINKSHEIAKDNTIVIGTFRGQPVHYTYGWEVSADGNMITHSGSNPSFTSNIIIMPEIGTAVCVMSNIQGNQAVDISKNIMTAVMGDGSFKYNPTNGPLDSFLSLCIVIAVALNIVTIIRLITLKKSITKKRKTKTKMKMILLIAKIIIYAGITASLGLWPYFAGYNYYIIRVWMPLTLIICSLCFLILASILLITAIIELISLYVTNPKDNMQGQI